MASNSNDETRKFSREALRSITTPQKPIASNPSVGKPRSISDIAGRLRYTKHMQAKPPEYHKLTREIQNTFRDPEGKDEQKMSKKNNLKESIRAFRNLAENSPMEAPVAGFNRHLRYMSPVTRDIVLKGYMPEIMAFATDRMVDPGIVIGIAEATMRMGRIPDPGMYGLAGDEALAVKHFLADTILNVAEDEVNFLNAVVEDNTMSPKAKHLKLASDYKKLAEFHKRRTKEEADKAKSAADDYREMSRIHHERESEKHDTLARHCMGLADYHQMTANEHPAADATKPVDYPASNPQKKPAEPPQDEETEKSPPTKNPQSESTDTFSRFRAFRAKMEDGEGDVGAPPAPPQPGRLAKFGAGLKRGAQGIVGGVGDVANTAAQKVGNVAANLASGAGAGAGAALSGVAGGVGSGVRNFGTGLATGKINMPKFASEATIDASLAAAMEPIGGSAFPQRGSIMPMIERGPVETKYTKWSNKFNRKGGEFSKMDGEKGSGQGYDTEQPGDEDERPTDKRKEADDSEPMESRVFRKAETMESMLAEARVAKSKKNKKKASKKVKADPDKAKNLLANARLAPLFYDLGHKMDHAETKINGKKFSPEWAKKLHSICLKDGGSAASDAVIKHSINNHWVREEGFTDESSNLRRNWETAMSKDATELAKGVTDPEPVVFAINNILHMSSK